MVGSGVVDELLGDVSSLARLRVPGGRRGDRRVEMRHLVDESTRPVRLPTRVDRTGALGCPVSEDVGGGDIDGALRVRGPVGDGQGRLRKREAVGPAVGGIGRLVLEHRHGCDRQQLAAGLVDREAVGDVGQCSVGQSGVVDECHRRLHEVTGRFAVRCGRDQSIGQRRTGGRLGPRLVEPLQSAGGVAGDLSEQGPSHERRVGTGGPEPRQQFEEDRAVGGTAEARKHDVDEVPDDVVLVSAGAQGHECAVGRLGATVAKCFGEGVERRVVLRSAVARFGGSARSRPGGRDVDDALPCGLSSLRRHRAEQLGSCHQFQRGVQRERARCFVARDRQQLARGAEQLGIRHSVEVPSGPCAGDVVGGDVVERVVSRGFHGSGLLVSAPGSRRDDGPAGARFRDEGLPAFGRNRRRRLRGAACPRLERRGHLGHRRHHRVLRPVQPHRQHERHVAQPRVLPDGAASPREKKP